MTSYVRCYCLQLVLLLLSLSQPSIFEPPSYMLLIISHIIRSQEIARKLAFPSLLKAGVMALYFSFYQSGIATKALNSEVKDKSRWPCMSNSLFQTSSGGSHSSILEFSPKCMGAKQWSIVFFCHSFGLFSLVL